MKQESVNHTEFESELSRLDKTIRLIQEEIDVLRENVEKNEKGILSFQEDLSGEISHSIGGSLYGSESFEQLVEASQFAMQLDDEVKKNERNIESLEVLERLVLSPYFARIDFTFPGKDEPSPIYIGRNSFMHELDILVHDWRSPIAGLFYKYGLGEASYNAPVGTITGEVSLKRQYEIKDSKLKFFFDTDMEILDEYLQDLLSQNASHQMKGIVETIQREQDAAIRDDENKLLVIQGSAGSGKTSIALHRIAYLMYKGLTDRLASDEIVILSPNNIFEQYISGILPELGERNVRSFILEDLYSKILGKSVKIQPRFSFIEQILAGEGFWIPVMQKSYEFKSSMDFVKILNALTNTGDSLKDIKSSYRNLFEIPGMLSKTANKAGITLPPGIDEIIEFTKENLASRKLLFDDASAIVYLYLKNTDYDDFYKIRQVAVDEAQDYSPIHFQILKLLFPKAKYTMLGDINQTIYKPETINFYEDITSMMAKEPAKLITLNKSFRSTAEISEFCSKISGNHIDSFGRSGSLPLVNPVRNEKDIDKLMSDAISYLEQGYGSVAIICKTHKECKRLHKLMISQRQGADAGTVPEVRLLEDTYAERLSGIILLPVYLAKGLEFDVSLVWIDSNWDITVSAERSLLFIACTRALHKLSLYSSNAEVLKYLTSIS